MSEMPSTAKQPEDHQTTKVKSAEPFAWTAPDGRRVDLKPFDRLPTGVFRKAKSMDEMEATFALIEAATDAAGLEVIDDLAIGDLDQLFSAWSAAAGVDLPQS